MLKSKEKMNAAEIVQRQLWRNGYSVKSVSLYTKYDLLVDEKIKVEVRGAKYKQTKTDIYWKFKNVTIEEANILAIVITTPLDDTLIYYIRISKNKGIVNGQDLKINTKELKALFTDSPSKIFNK